MNWVALSFQLETESDSWLVYHVKTRPSNVIGNSLSLKSWLWEWAVEGMSYQGIYIPYDVLLGIPTYHHILGKLEVCSWLGKASWLPFQGREAWCQRT